LLVGLVAADALMKWLPADVPLWLLKVDGLDVRPPISIRPIPDITAAFEAEILRAAPSGPLTLVGMSFGGLIAFDLTCRLRERGHEVQALLIEPPIPGLVRELQAERLRRHRANLRSLTVSQRITYLWERGMGVLRRSLQRLYVRLRIALGGEPSLKLLWLYYLSQVLGRIEKYQPRPCSGSVHLAGRPDWLEAHLAAWRSLVEGTAVPCPLPLANHHDAVICLPAATAWMDVLREWYREPTESTGRPPQEIG